MTSSDRTGEIDWALQGVVEGAFPETIVEVVEESGDQPPAYRSDNAEAAWKRMHDAAKGREIAVLLGMLDGTWLTGEERWKAVTFLGYSLRTPEALPHRDAILQALAAEAAIKQRGVVRGDPLRLQGAALAAVAGAPVGADAKWQFMLEAVQGSRSHFSEILQALSGFLPSSATAAADAQPILLDAMVRSDLTADLDHVTQLVRELDVRSSAPDIRRLLLAANSHLSARVAQILADWGDKEAAFEVRRAIHQYGNTSDTNVDDLVDALYRLEGSACSDDVAGAFRSAPPALQEYMLDHSLRRIPSVAVAQAAREILDTTKDVDLKRAAKDYLDSVPAAAGTETVAAASAAATLSPGPRSADATAADAGGWQPVYADTSAPPEPAPAPAPPPPPPPSEPAPSGGSWQPAGPDPQSARTGAADDSRSRRLGVDAETLAILREEAEAERAAAEQRAQQAAAGGPDPLELLVRLPQILFALAVIGALLVLYLTGGGGGE